MLFPSPACRTEFDRLTARALCQASIDAYRPSDSDGRVLLEWKADYGLSISIDQTGTECRILGDDRTVIVAFRGTSDGHDLRTDLRVQRVAWQFGAVHAGFLDAWKSIRAPILNVLHEYGDNGQQLYVTGHSLGGALATLCAYEFELARTCSVSGLYTFGSPRVFDRDGAIHAERILAGSVFRVVHSNDGVSRVPRVFRRNLGWLPGWLPWIPTCHPMRHIGRLIFLTEDGHILGDRSRVSMPRLAIERVTGWRLDVGRDHTLTQYLEGLT